MKKNPKKLVTLVNLVYLFMCTSGNTEEKKETAESDEKVEEDPRPGTKKEKNPKKGKISKLKK